MMARTCLAVVLAAGEGTRMRSPLPKVMHKVAGLPMVQHVMQSAQAAECSDIAVVAGNGFELVTGIVTGAFPDASIFEQKKRLGTGHAVLAAREAIEKGYDDVIVLFGDTPLLRAETLVTLRETLNDGAAVAVIGFRTDQPDGYGRLIEKDGKLLAIREHKDASATEREITFCNGGIMGLSGAHALELLDALTNDNANQEYYLTDVVEIGNTKGLPVVAMEASETEVMGVNTRNNLAEVEAIWQRRRRTALMASGVTIQAPETVFLSADTIIDADVVIEPNVVFGPGVHVKSGAQIRAFSHIEGAIVGDEAVIGPYARLRPGTVLEAGTKVGNF
ncbi:MAG: NTP transferase domain-containing protein, partial [Pseudomonadota bacterium]